jgi:hypothetical protein
LTELYFRHVFKYIREYFSCYIFPCIQKCFHEFRHLPVIIQQYYDSNITKLQINYQHKISVYSACKRKVRSNIIMLQKLIVTNSVEIKPGIYKTQKIFTSKQKFVSVSKLSQINPIHKLPNYNLEIYFIFTLQFTPTSSPWSVYLKFPQQLLYRLYPPPYIPHAPSTTSLFIWSAEYNFLINTNNKSPHYANPPITCRP